MLPLPKVVIVGGVDVDMRLELMYSLKNAFNISAVGSDSALHSRFASSGFEYASYNLSRRTNVVLDLWGVGQLACFFRRTKPQIVHTFATKPGVWGRLAAHLAGVPIIIGTLPGLGSLYSSETFSTKLTRAAYQPLQRSACHMSDLTIFQNGDDMRQFIAAGVVPERKATIIPGSGVSTDLYDPIRVSKSEQAQLRCELGIQPEEIVVTLISRVIRSKGVLEFMAAAQNIGALYPKVRFLLVGPDDQASVDRLTPMELTQLRQVVTWPGSRSDVPTVLAMSDIFVLPSAYREGIPRVLLEAASMELPIVTTDSPGCNEVVEQDSNGMLVPVHDSEALSKAILSLIERPELRRRYGQVSRQRARRKFDLSVIAKQTHSMYSQLLESKLQLPVASRLMESN